jgi:hypothetical protein
LNNGYSTATTPQNEILHSVFVSINQKFTDPKVQEKKAGKFFITPFLPKTCNKPHAQYCQLELHVPLFS